MRSRPTRTAAVAALAASVLAACTPVHPSAGGDDSDSPSATPSATASSSTPTPSPTPSASGSGSPAQPLHGLVVVVDPGHNGGNSSHVHEIAKQVDAGGLRKPCNTTGTETNAGYPEHAFTWNVARRLAALLRRDGATVVLTRHGDHGVGPCVDVRGRTAARHHADLLVSIHGDGAASSAHGFTVLRPGKVRGYTATTYRRSEVLAGDVADAMVSHGFQRSTYLGSRGIDVRRDLGTLNRAPVPAIMLEAGNMRNAADARVMSSGRGRQRVAAALADAIAAFTHRK